MKRVAEIVAPILANKYLLAGVLFLIWLAFFDQNSILSRIRALRELHQLEDKALHYQQKIEADRKRVEALSSGNEALEKFARETYYMKAPNEEIFLIEE
ncbi:MAG: septum formation initiator family protein [Bacteroidales bacterium]